MAFEMSSVSRRLHAASLRYGEGSYEEALINIFPAMDVTSKRRYPSKKKVAERVKAFINDEQKLVWGLATNTIIGQIDVDGISFPHALYKFARNALTHDAGLEERISFKPEMPLSIGYIWNLPPTFIMALIIVLVCAPENAGERFEPDLRISIRDHLYNVNELWGDRESIVRLLEGYFGSGALSPHE